MKRDESLARDLARLNRWQSANLTAAEDEGDDSEVKHDQPR